MEGLPITASQLPRTRTSLRFLVMERIVRRCSKDIPMPELVQHGMCPELRRQLTLDLGFDVELPENARVFSRLGKAKYHIYTPGVKFSKRRRRSRAQGASPSSLPSADLPSCIAADVAHYLAGEDDEPSRISAAVCRFLAGEDESSSDDDRSCP